VIEQPSTDSDPGDSLDRAPGDTIASAAGLREGIRAYCIGLALAVVLTLASFWAAHSQLIYGPAVPVAIAVLAFAQMGIHLVFFLHITTGPDNTNNVLALAFGVLIAALIIFGSIWIMAHLNSHLMPMHPAMSRDSPM
jgi:cytochrome o ubiquinol oxidase operon protein cyoD